MSYHIIAIDPERYHRIYSFDANSLAEAAQVALSPKYRRVTMATVLRDGSNGRRYSLAQCEQIVKEAA